MFWCNQRMNQGEGRTLPNFSGIQTRETSPLYSNEGVKVKQVKKNNNFGIQHSHANHPLVSYQWGPINSLLGIRCVCIGSCYEQAPGNRQGPDLCTRLSAFVILPTVFPTRRLLGMTSPDSMPRGKPSGGQIVYDIEPLNSCSGWG